MEKDEQLAGFAADAATVEAQISRRHHYVPEFLLKPWAVCSCLHGYWWDWRRGLVAVKRRGPKAFCFVDDLLLLRRDNRGRDVIERRFFQAVDQAGARARARMITSGPEGLTLAERCDFARLLFSLEARRPSFVGHLKAAGREHLARGLDGDPAIQRIASEEAQGQAPSEFVESQLGVSLEDRALTMVRGLTDNQIVGPTLINSRWTVLRTDESDPSQSLVLSDRPLIRTGGYLDPRTIWILPLTPHALFLASSHAASIAPIIRLKPSRLAKECNRYSAAQVDRFLFSTFEGHRHWMEGHLKRAANKGPDKSPKWVFPLAEPASPDHDGPYL